jgi:hypothetical protein
MSKTNSHITRHHRSKIDPEELIGQQLSGAKELICKWNSITCNPDHPLDEALITMMTAAMHLCDAEKIDFKRAYRSAKWHYKIEREM